MLQQHAGKVDAGELAPLVAVEDVRLAMPGQGLLQRFDAEVGFHRDRHPMRENPPAEHVDDRRQVDEAARQRDVGDVHRPHLIGPFDLQPAQQVGVDLVAGRGFAGVRTAIDGCDPDALHQARHVAPADRDALPVQEVAQHPAARKRVAEMQFVEAAHGPQILGRGWPGFVVDGASADAERLGLPGDRQVVLTVDHRLALSNPALVSAPSKKSFSKVSSPILA